MNYRHAYHAGNFADAVKHTVLLMVLDYLLQKDKPIFCLDTHAGIGLYDLSGTEAQKTGEWQGGIGKLWDIPNLPEPIQRYVSAMKALNEGDGFQIYAGSPALIAQTIRPQDRFVACDLHPVDAQTLSENIADMGQGRVKIEQGDGYQTSKALLPPPERRGLVLIDPPFEDRGEFAQLTRALRHALKRWATGVYMIWYPIKDKATVTAWHNDLREINGLPETLAVEFYLRPPTDPDLLNGTGLLIVNPPYQLADNITDILPAFLHCLTGGKGTAEVVSL